MKDEVTLPLTDNDPMLIKKSNVSIKRYFSEKNKKVYQEDNFYAKDSEVPYHELSIYNCVAASLHFDIVKRSSSV